MQYYMLSLYYSLILFNPLHLKSQGCKLSFLIKGEYMARVRNNQGHRNKILNIFMRPYLEQEHTQEKEAFDQARETIKPLQDKTWQLASNIVGRFYTPNDVKMAYHLQNKFPNVNTIAKDSCFHFGYMNKADGSEEETNPFDHERHNESDDETDKYITKHFDFRLDGNINGK